MKVKNKSCHHHRYIGVAHFSIHTHTHTQVLLFVPPVLLSVVWKNPTSHSTTRDLLVVSRSGFGGVGVGIWWCRGRFFLLGSVLSIGVGSFCRGRFFLSTWRDYSLSSSIEEMLRIPAPSSAPSDVTPATNLQFSAHPSSFSSHHIYPDKVRPVLSTAAATYFSSAYPSIKYPMAPALYTVFTGACQQGRAPRVMEVGHEIVPLILPSVAQFSGLSPGPAGGGGGLSPPTVFNCYSLSPEPGKGLTSAMQPSGRLSPLGTETYPLTPRVQQPPTSRLSSNYFPLIATSSRPPNSSVLAVSSVEPSGSHAELSSVEARTGFAGIGIRPAAQAQFLSLMPEHELVPSRKEDAAVSHLCGQSACSPHAILPDNQLNPTAPQISLVGLTASAKPVTSTKLLTGSADTGIGNVVVGRVQGQKTVRKMDVPGGERICKGNLSLTTNITTAASVVEAPTTTSSFSSTPFPFRVADQQESVAAERAVPTTVGGSTSAGLADVFAWAAVPTPGHPLHDPASHLPVPPASAPLNTCASTQYFPVSPFSLAPSPPTSPTSSASSASSGSLISSLLREEGIGNPLGMSDIMCWLADYCVELALHVRLREGRGPWLPRAVRRLYPNARFPSQDSPPRPTDETVRSEEALATVKRDEMKMDNEQIPEIREPRVVVSGLGVPQNPVTSRLGSELWLGNDALTGGTYTPGRKFRVTVLYIPRTLRIVLVAALTMVLLRTLRIV